MAGSSWEDAWDALRGTIARAPGFAQAPAAVQASAQPQMVGDWWDRNVGIGPGPAQRVANRKALSQGVDLLAANPSGGPAQAAAATIAHFRDKMLESGGPMPPAAKPATALSPDMFTKAPAVMQTPAQPKTPLQEVLANMVAANPDAKLTFGQLQKLGSVFPGVSSTSKMSGKDAAIYAAMQADQEQYMKHMSGIEAQERAGQLDAQAAAELRDAAAINRKNFLARMGIGQTDDKTNLAEYLKDAQKEQ